jgi:hypothetical protein
VATFEGMVLTDANAFTIGSARVRQVHLAAYNRNEYFGHL